MAVDDTELFASGMRDRPYTVSITFDDGFHLEMNEDPALFKVYMQLEPPEVMDYLHEQEGNPFNTKDIIIACHTHYDLILAWDEDILRECPNAVLFPQALCTWIDQCYTVVKKDSDDSTRNDSV
jgi:hypothetical protein